MNSKFNYFLLDTVVIEECASIDFSRFFQKKLDGVAHVQFNYTDIKKDMKIYFLDNRNVLVGSRNLPQNYILTSKSSNDFEFIIYLSSNVYVYFQERTVVLESKNQKIFLKFDYKSTFDEWRPKFMKYCINTCFNDLYVLRHLLGKGGYAHVYLTSLRTVGVPRLSPNTYASKILQKDRIKTEKNKKYIINEINIMQSIHHPYIIDFYEVYETTNHVVFLYECMEGKDLSQHLKSGNCSEDQALLITRMVLEAISYMSKRFIVHRDIKPSNIMIDEKLEKIKIIDFGLCAQINQSAIAKSMLMDRSGTVGYMAPEVLSKTREFGMTTSKGDIFSAGIVLYEMVTNSNPFKTQSYKATMKKNYNCIIDLTHQSISTDVREVLELMVNRDPNKRAHAEDILNKDVFSCNIYENEEEKISYDPDKYLKPKLKKHLDDMHTHLPVTKSNLRFPSSVCNGQAANQTLTFTASINISQDFLSENNDPSKNNVLSNNNNKLNTSKKEKRKHYCSNNQTKLSFNFCQVDSLKDCDEDEENDDLKEGTLIQLPKDAQNYYKFKREEK